MALTPSFTVSRLANLTDILLTDTSTGSDGAITVRWVYLQKSDGTYLVPSGTTTDYVVWAIGNPTITLDVLNIDYALTITVQWRNNSSMLYEATVVVDLPSYGKYNGYYFTQLIARSPTLMNNKNFWDSYAKLFACIIGSENAVEVASDTAGAQVMLNNAAKLYNNPLTYFN